MGHGAGHTRTGRRGRAATGSPPGSDSSSWKPFNPGAHAPTRAHTRPSDLVSRLSSDGNCIRAPIRPRFKKSPCMPICARAPTRLRTDAPPHSLHVARWRPCSHIDGPPHSLHVLRWRTCSHIEDPPHSLHLLFSFPCSHMCCHVFRPTRLRLYPPPSSDTSSYSPHAVGFRSRLALGRGHAPRACVGTSGRATMCRQCRHFKPRCLRRGFVTICGGLLQCPVGRWGPLPNSQASEMRHAHGQVIYFRLDF